MESMENWKLWKLWKGFERFNQLENLNRFMDLMVNLAIARLTVNGQQKRSHY